MTQRYDPLLITAVTFLAEEKERLLEQLSDTKFDGMYELGLIQGKLQGIAIARKAIDDASRAMDKE